MLNLNQLKNIIYMVFIFAFIGCGYSGNDYSKLIDNIASKDGDIRKKAMLEFNRMGDAAIPPLTKALKSKNYRVRLSAVVTLLTIDHKLKDKTVPLLESALNDENEKVRNMAKFGLKKIKEDEKIRKENNN